jgi:MarR family transcriptional repressor of emrRAB
MNRATDLEVANTPGPADAGPAVTEPDPVNLLGALVLALADRLRKATAAAAGHGAEDPGAIVALHWTPDISIEHLARLIDRSHAATVRLVARLELDGLLHRTVGRGDRRVRTVRLTAAGDEVAARVLVARRAVLDTAFGAIAYDGPTRAAVSDAIGTMLAAIATPEAAETMCRLCDEAVCPPEICPITIAVLAAGGVVGPEVDHADFGRPAADPDAVQPTVDAR